MKWSEAEVVEVRPATVTVTSTVPDPAGDVTVNWVVVAAVTVPAFPVPKSTVSLPSVVLKLVPHTVTEVPPPEVPEGLVPGHDPLVPTLVTVGKGGAR